MIRKQSDAVERIFEKDDNHSIFLFSCHTITKHPNVESVREKQKSLTDLNRFRYRNKQ